jgi:GIY-YIG catalytic domain
LTRASRDHSSVITYKRRPLAARLKAGHNGAAGAVKGGYVYIMTNKAHGTLYIGVTGNLPRRIWKHREGVIETPGALRIL